MFFGAVYAIGGLMIVRFAFAMDYPYLAYPLTMGFALFAPCDFVRNLFVLLLFRSLSTRSGVSAVA